MLLLALVGISVDVYAMVGEVVYGREAIHGRGSAVLNFDSRTKYVVSTLPWSLIKWPRPLN